jgi:hypothetical protein
MPLTRAEVLRVLRRAGLFELADKLAAQLPEYVDQDSLDRIHREHHVDLDVLIDRMGGSP